MMGNAPERATLLIDAEWKDCAHGGGWWIAHDADGQKILLSGDLPRADLAPAPSWQPIETAPKDGTRFLGYWPCPEDEIEAQAECRTWWGFDKWQNAWSSSDLEPSPTHWMPLPAPPEAS